jgi:hypothetical protein
MNSLVQRRRAQDVARRLWRVLTTADSPPPSSPPSSEQLVSLSKSARSRRKRWTPQGLATLGLQHQGTMPPPSATSSNSPLPDPWRSSWSIEDVGISLGWPRYGKLGDQEENQGRGSSSPQPPPSPFPLNAYIDLPKDVLPEGEASFYHNPKLTQQQVHQSNHGCKGALAEFAHSKRRSIILRQSMVDLFRVVAEGQHSRMFVDGWAGSGKSIALYALAALARSAGWVVMYVPSASMLTRGGRYFKRGGHNDDDDDDDRKIGDKERIVYWDTPESARRIIQAVMGAHATELASMPPGKLATSFSAFASCSSLAEIAEMGLATTAFTSETAPITVEAALALADGLLSYEGPGPRTLVIVDEYNALYSYTEYFEVMHAHYSRRLSPDELRLASGLRGCCPSLHPPSASAPPSTTSSTDVASLPASNAKNGIFVASPSRGGAFSNKIRIPFSPGTFKFYIPRYSLSEVAVTAAATAEKKKGKDEGTTAGGVVDVPSDNALRHALALTNGNAKELRENAEALLTDQTTMGVSFGYKVTAAAVKKYNATVE